MISKKIKNKNQRLNLQQEQVLMDKYNTKGSMASKSFNLFALRFNDLSLSQPTRFCRLLEIRFSLRSN